MTTETPMRQRDIYKALCLLADANGLRPIDVARAIGVQPGAMKRRVRGNPTVRFLEQVAWALGCDRMWLLMDPEQLKLWIDGTCIKFDGHTRAHEMQSRVLAMSQAKKARRARAKVSTDVVPSREELLEVYPAAAMKETIQDTNYVDFTASGMADREEKREELSAGLPEHLCMADRAVEQGYSYKAYAEGGWSLEDLAKQGLIVARASIKGEA